MIWAVTTRPMASAMVTTQISNHIGDPPLVADMQRPYEDLVSFFKSLTARNSHPDTVVFRNKATRRRNRPVRGMRYCPNLEKREWLVPPLRGHRTNAET